MRSPPLGRPRKLHIIRPAGKRQGLIVPLLVNSSTPTIHSSLSSNSSGVCCGRSVDPKSKIWTEQARNDNG